MQVIFQMIHTGYLEDVTVAKEHQLEHELKPMIKGRLGV